MRLPTVLAVAALALASAWIALTAPPVAPAPGHASASADSILTAAPLLTTSGTVTTARLPVHAPDGNRLPDDPARDSALPPSKLAPPFIVYGTVYREDGSPASCARVALGKLSAACNVRGMFRIETRVQPSPDASVVAWEAGFAPANLPNVTARLPDLRPGVAAGPLGLFLGPRLPAVSGVVVDANGRPAKGWTLTIEPPADAADSRPREPGSTARSTRTGSFTLTAVHPGPCRLVARRGKQRITTELTVPPDGLRALRLTPN